MAARVIDGRAIAASLKEELSAEVSRLLAGGIRPGLATLLAGSSYEAKAYEERLRDLTRELGCRYVCEALGEDAPEEEVLSRVAKLNEDPETSGILVLKPLPDHLSEAALCHGLIPSKDIEAVHPENAGLLASGRPRYVPSTPAACFLILDHYLKEAGRDPREFYPASHVVVVGRSNNVGKPAVHLAFARGATVTSCDVNTYRAGRLREFTLQADVLIVATGVPHLIGGSCVKEGVIAIDVGINPVEDPESGETKLVGDLDFQSVAEKAGAITPVPGGVGPVTDVCLLQSVVLAAERSRAGGKVYHLQHIRE
jgi:methylenetetrahydrofolate dehydrogenase (NADP+)/methenyltetrahydrofolate cyclohydrolase